MARQGFTDVDVPDQSGKTFFVTGANTGLGFETSKVLASKGAWVLPAAATPRRPRTPSRGSRPTTPRWTWSTWPSTSGTSRPSRPPRRWCSRSLAWTG